MYFWFRHNTYRMVAYKKPKLSNKPFGGRVERVVTKSEQQIHLTLQHNHSLGHRLKTRVVTKKVQPKTVKPIFWIYPFWMHPLRVYRNVSEIYKDIQYKYKMPSGSRPNPRAAIKQIGFTLLELPEKLAPVASCFTPWRSIGPGES